VEDTLQPNDAAAAATVAPVLQYLRQHLTSPVRAESCDNTYADVLAIGEIVRKWNPYVHDMNNKISTADVHNLKALIPKLPLPDDDAFEAECEQYWTLSVEVDGSTGLLAWWSTQRDALPLMCEVFVYLCLFPTSSAAAERLGSKLIRLRDGALNTAKSDYLTSVALGFKNDCEDIKMNFTVNVNAQS